MKNPPCQSAWRVSEAYSVERYQLFSSFLRGASRPKSPRVTASTATHVYAISPHSLSRPMFPPL